MFQTRRFVCRPPLCLNQSIGNMPFSSSFRPPPASFSLARHPNHSRRRISALPPLLNPLGNCVTQEKQKHSSSSLARPIHLQNRQFYSTTAINNNNENFLSTFPPDPWTVVPNIENLAKGTFQLDHAGKEQLEIRLQGGGGDRNFFEIFKTIETPEKSEISGRTSILVPEDAYAIVGALDQMMAALATKWETQDGPKVEIAEVRRPYYGYICMFETKEWHNFTIASHLYGRSRGANKFIEELRLPIRALPWLRQQMEDMLAHHDGSKQLLAAPQIPNELLELMERGGADVENMAKGTFRLNHNSRVQQLEIRLQKRREGRHFFEIFKTIETPEKSEVSGRTFNMVPEDAYAIVDALDQMIAALATKWAKGQLPEVPPGKRSSMDMKIAEVKRPFYSYTFCLYIYEESETEKEIGFKICSYQSEQTKCLHQLLLPIRALPWLRQQMADMLARHDGSKQLPAASKIPNELLDKLTFYSLLLPIHSPPISSKISDLPALASSATSPTEVETNSRRPRRDSI